MHTWMEWLDTKYGMYTLTTRDIMRQKNWPSLLPPKKCHSIIWDVTNFYIVSLCVIAQSRPTKQSTVKPSFSIALIWIGVVSIIIAYEQWRWSSRFYLSAEFHMPALYFIKAISDMDQKYYPETLNKLYLVNAPSAFVMVWKVVKAWLDPGVSQDTERESVCV